jgi:effector-binding domain-containing protein
MMKIKSLTQFVGVTTLLIWITSNQANSQDFPTIEVMNISAQSSLVVKAEVLSTEVGQKIGSMFGQLFAFTAANNINMTGAPFAVYYSYDPNGNTSFEAGLPVPYGTKGNDSILFKEYPAMKVVCTIYKGSYDNMSPVYTKIQEYMTINKLKSTGISWEVYLTDPSTVKDPNENRTMIYFPVE